MKIVKVFPYQSSGQLHSDRRFAILKRTDGRYTVADQYYYQSFDEDGSIIAEGWATLPPEGLFDCETTAEQEVKSKINPPN